jgi:hypothetical protein
MKSRALIIARTFFSIAFLQYVKVASKVERLSSFSSNITQPGNAELVHFNSQLEEVVETSQYQQMSHKKRITTYLSHCVFAL